MSPEFREKALPLAAFLASRHIKDEIHQTFMADLYDIVNEIRDNIIRAALIDIEVVQKDVDYLVNEHKQNYVEKRKCMIRWCQGA